MTTFTWKIEQLDRQSSNGFVTVVHYRVLAFDEGCSATLIGTVNFEQAAEDDVFTPFEQLTKEVVLGWVHTAVNQTDTEASLQTQIDAQKTPTTLTGVPWIEEQA